MITDDCILLNALKTGDASAFEAIYKAYWQELYLLAYKKTHCRETAEELTQNLFVSLWKRRESNTIEELGKYLHKAMRYSIINHFKSNLVKNKQQAILKQTAVTSVHPVAESTLAARQFQKEIENALAALPPKTQTVFRLSRYNQFSIKEIAAQLQMNEKAVEYHITQSLKHVRTQLKEYILTVLILISCS